MDMAVTIFTALSVNRLLILRRMESTYGIATRVRYSAVVVIEDQRLRADPCVPSVISCFSFNRDISDLTEPNHTLLSSFRCSVDPS